MRHEERRKRLRWMRPLMILAIIAGMYMIFQKVNYERRDFYAEFYSPNDLATSVDAQLPTQALTDFNEGRFEEALPQFARGSYGKNRTKEGAASLYVGICQMELGNHWEAITALEQAKLEQPSLTQQAEWFKILSLIGLKEKEQAISMLEYYTEQADFDFKKAEAQQLLKDY